MPRGIFTHQRGPIGDRFWVKVDRSGGPDACWPWFAHRTSKGYGTFQLRPQGSQRAHRVAFFLVHGWWPPVVMHTCDNPPCCNPAHLVAGTQADNIADRHTKGRTNIAVAVAAHAAARRAARLCKRGHEFDESNTGWTPQGARRCRACAREKARRLRVVA